MTIVAPFVNYMMATQFVLLLWWGTQVSAICGCGHRPLSQSVQHVVVDCGILNAPDGFAGLRG